MEPDDKKPICSHNLNNETELLPDNISSKHIASASSKDGATDITTPVTPQPFILESNFNIGSSEILENASESMQPITSQPRLALITPRSIAENQPQSLFIQALSQLNESSLSIGVINHMKTSHLQNQKNINTRLKTEELSPADSLNNAPPSYSFVLRQMAARRRPRLMGTFIPSPSFVQHTPPPNYATPFDIYIDNAVPPPPSRVYNFSFASMPVVCPECGFAGMTTITSKITMCTHLCAFILCILFCWVCVPLPYVLRSCKNVYHYCRNCRNFLGMYCPTSPDNSYR